jgi:rhodanese-related sulfurtransferase
MINRNLAKALSFRYVFLAVIMIVLAGGLLILPKFEKHEGINPEALLSNVISPERYISTDQLAEIYINQDPSYLVIDVRPESEYLTYNLPNSFNIPLNTILNEEAAGYLNQDQYDVVLVSNDNFSANQAWILCNRLGYKNLHVLKGGLNEWFNTIINPKKPTETMSAKEHELYNFRKASSMFFGVAYPEEIKVFKKPAVKAPVKKVVVPVKKKKKMPTEGGC